MPTLEAAARRLKRGRREDRFPTLWLFSDPARLPDPAGPARRLPPGAGVVARGLAPAALRSLVRIARARRLCLMVAGDGRLALALKAGLHLPERRPSTGLLPFLLARRAGAAGALLTVATHGGMRAARFARRIGPDLAFLSPVFPTASHPGARGLGPLRWAVLARRQGGPIAALGGLDGANAARLPRHAVALAAIGGLAGS